MCGKSPSARLIIIIEFQHFILNLNFGLIIVTIFVSSRTLPPNHRNKKGINNDGCSLKTVEVVCVEIIACTFKRSCFQRQQSFLCYQEY